jgi:hypothetical protein
MERRTDSGFRKRRRSKTSSGDGSKTIRTTKAGPALSSALRDDRAWKVWGDCYQASIAGLLAAHRSTPKPRLVVKMAARIADLAVVESMKRRPS